MKYLKHSELTKLHSVSDKTVRNWIEAARQGKLDLELFKHNDRLYIADTLSNNLRLEELAARSRKYRNKRAHKDATPSPAFYSLYSHEQILDIIANLDANRELPHQYRFCDAGATYWDAYLHKLYAAGKRNTLIDTIELLQLNGAYINSLIGPYESVNVIDIGVGNGLAIKKFLAHIQETGKLKRYVGIDISKELLNVTEQNLRKWFGKEISVEKYVKDITYARFGEILAYDSFGKDATHTINLVLLLGGTISNFRDPGQALQTIRDSMNRNDLLICSLKPDGKDSRRFFDFNIESDKIALPLHDRLLLNLLNIDDSSYELEQFFDEQQACRIIQVRLKIAHSIHFEVNKFKKTIALQKGERILLWRAHHFNTEDAFALLNRSSLNVIQASQTSTEDHLLLISKVKSKEHTPPPKITS